MKSSAPSAPVHAVASGDKEYSLLLKLLQKQANAQMVSTVAVNFSSITPEIIFKKLQYGNLVSLTL
jgi:hypothetical protein